MRNLWRSVGQRTGRILDRPGYRVLRADRCGGQNAGAVFTNPENESAGRLIDAAGCKGLRIGTAYVSEKHANFIQVDHGGNSEDVAALIEEIRNQVFEKFGIELNCENHLLGFG